MSIIRGVRRPNRSARIPKMRAPTGRMASVSVTANKTAGSPTLNSFAIRSVTKVTRKKSKASSDQPRKLARKVYRWSRERDRIKLHAPMICDSFHEGKNVSSSHPDYRLRALGVGQKGDDL